MSEWTEAEKYLLEQIRRGDSEAWEQLVQRYQGRLVAFARSRHLPDADAEDLVQETFVHFLRGLPAFRAEASVETYLFVILRRRVVEHFRGRRLNACSLQDAPPGAGRDPDAREAGSSALLPGSEPTASWYARRDEARDAARSALSAALRGLLDGMKEPRSAQPDFRDLQIVEMLFYAQQRNKNIAREMGLDEKYVALVKHRWLKQLRERVAQALARHPSAGEALSAIGSETAADSLLTEIWEAERPSCPKRSTVGGYLLGTLEKAWHDYVDFHVRRLGCRFCQANLEDLRREARQAHRQAASPDLRNRIMQSTVGFFRKP
jgi:RNA polymerase sigma-70 factor, ECF subfamily